MTAPRLLLVVGFLGAATSLAAETHIERIPVVAERFNSPDYDVAVQEAIDAINFLNGGGSSAGFDFDALPEDAVAIYYVDFVIGRLIDDGPESFAANELPLHELTVRDIERGFQRVGAIQHASLFRRFLGDARRRPSNVSGYNRLFRDLQQVENLRTLNEALLRRSTVFAAMSETEANTAIAALIAEKIAGETSH